MEDSRLGDTSQSVIKDVYIKYAGVLLILVLTLYNLRGVDFPQNPGW